MRGGGGGDDDDDEGPKLLPPDHLHTRTYISVLQGLERATAKFMQYRTRL